jgi:hypothetical protein
LGWPRPFKTSTWKLLLIWWPLAQDSLTLLISFIHLSIDHISQLGPLNI